MGSFHALLLSEQFVVPTDRGQAQIVHVGDVEVVDAGTGVGGHVFG
jgi:hypothetical protein